MKSQITTQKDLDGWRKCFAFIPHKVWLDEYERDIRYRWVWWEWLEYRPAWTADFMRYDIYRFPKRGS